ncbi:hypothetical protein M422DRAFT_274754 [Sphaerobolus stellatus SS14]|uniref:Uncharacterized protein n=1 Tax=Sphaerobolus stellatus (strain SS14) TaxID=990650 RepID=A0A0C9U5U1_SPHS4|nr:hypothetical protein M422DRAFT_274754 [Sphaerobolus stellatus SS14]
MHHIRNVSKHDSVAGLRRLLAISQIVQLLENADDSKLEEQAKSNLNSLAMVSRATDEESIHSIYSQITDEESSSLRGEGNWASLITKGVDNHCRNSERKETISSSGRNHSNLQRLLTSDKCSISYQCASNLSFRPHQLESLRTIPPTQSTGGTGRIPSQNKRKRSV